MNLEIGLEVTAVTIFEKVVTGTVTSILEKSIVIENKTGRHVVKRTTLKEMGYTLPKYIRPDLKRMYIHPKV